MRELHCKQVLREKPDDARALSLLVDTYAAQNQRAAATEKITATGP